MPAIVKIFSAYNPTKIVTPDALVHELEFGVLLDFAGSPTVAGPKNYDFRVPLVPSPSGESDERITLFIKILVGSFKMSVGNDPSANPLDLIVGDTFTVTVQNRVTNLFFKSAAPAAEFFVSA